MDLSIVFFGIFDLDDIFENSGEKQLSDIIFVYDIQVYRYIVQKHWKLLEEYKNTSRLANHVQHKFSKNFFIFVGIMFELIGFVGSRILIMTISFKPWTK